MRTKKAAKKLKKSKELESNKSLTMLHGANNIGSASAGGGGGKA